MAYAYEYQPKAAVLVYPGIVDSRSFEEEERETIALLKEAENRGGIALSSSRTVQSST